MKIKLSLVLSSILINNALYAADSEALQKSKFFLIGAQANTRSSVASNIIDKSAHQSEFATLKSKIADPEYQKELINSVQTKEGLEKFIANLPAKSNNKYKKAIEQKQSDYLKKVIPGIQQGFSSTLNQTQIQEYKEKLNPEQKEEFEKITKDAIVEKLNDEIPAVYKDALSSNTYKIFDSNLWDKNEVLVMMLGKGEEGNINSVEVDYEFDKANLYTRENGSENDNDINFVYLTNGENKTNLTYNISSKNASFTMGISAQTPVIGKNSNLTINMPNNDKKVNLKDISVGFSDERFDDISLINDTNSQSSFKLVNKGDIAVSENNQTQIKLNKGATYELISQGNIEFNSALATKIKTYDKKYYEQEEKTIDESWQYQVLDIADGANFRLKANNIQNKGFILASGDKGKVSIEASNKFTNGANSQSSAPEIGDLIKLDIESNSNPKDDYRFDFKAKVENKNFLLAKDSGEVKIASKTVKNNGTMANLGGAFKIDGNLDTSSGTLIAGQSSADSELGGFYVTGVTVLDDNTKIALALHKDSNEPLKGDTAYNIIQSERGILGDEKLKEENIYLLKLSGDAKNLKIDEVKNTEQAKDDGNYLKVEVASSTNNLYYKLGLTEEALTKPIDELIVVNPPKKTQNNDNASTQDPSTQNPALDPNKTQEDPKTKDQETKTTNDDDDDIPRSDPTKVKDQTQDNKIANKDSDKKTTQKDDEEKSTENKEDIASQNVIKRPELSKEDIQALAPKIDNLKNLTKTYGVSMFSQYEKAIKENDQNAAYMIYDSIANMEKSTNEFSKAIAKKQNIQNIINLSSAMNTQTRLAKLSDPTANYFATRELIDELNGEQYARSLIILSDVEDELVTRLRDKKAVINNKNTPNSFWFNTIGSKGKLEGDTTLKMAGFSIGIDKQNDNNIIGAYTMLAKSKAVAGDTKSDTKHVQLGSYARFFNENYEFDINAFYTLGINKNQRSVQFFGDNLNYDSNGKSHTFGLGGSLGYAFSVFDSGIIKPSIGANFYISRLPELKEEGELGLKRDSSTNTLASLVANVELRYYMIGGGYFYLVPGIESEVYKKDDSKISFNGYETIAQSISNNKKKTYTTLLGGTELKMTPNSSFNLGLGTKIGKDEKYYNVNAGFKVKF